MMFHLPTFGFFLAAVMVVAFPLGNTMAFCPVPTMTTTTATIPLSVRNGPSPVSKSALSMGLMDAFSKAFENKEYGPPPEAVQASARHILVPTEAEAQIVMKMISSGEQSFEECAQEFSTCPSASKGGSLGSFAPGTMVKEFDEVIFNPETRIGQILGPVMTQFGYHVIVVDKRKGGGDKY